MLPAHVVYSTSNMDEARFDKEAERLRERMRSLETEAPIAYRKQNFGDYHIPEMTLREGLEMPGETGFALHIRKDSGPTA